jgi:hypothetical protein
METATEDGRHALLACLGHMYVIHRTADVSAKWELDGGIVLLVAYRLASGMPASSGLVKGHPHYCCNLYSLVVCESIMLLEIA